MADKTRESANSSEAPTPSASRRRFLRRAGAAGIALSAWGKLLPHAPAESASAAVAAQALIGYVIAQPCVSVKSGACAEVCPVECIVEGPDQWYIDTRICINCGACEPECPVDAIFAGDAVPEQWSSYGQKAERFFANR